MCSITTQTSMGFQNLGKVTTVGVYGFFVLFCFNQSQLKCMKEKGSEYIK